MSTDNLPFSSKTKKKKKKERKKITLNYPKFAGIGFFLRDSRTSSRQPYIVNEPSVFEPLRLYCILIRYPISEMTG